MLYLGLSIAAYSSHDTLVNVGAVASTLVPVAIGPLFIASLLYSRRG